MKSKIAGAAVAVCRHKPEIPRGVELKENRAVEIARLAYLERRFAVHIAAAVAEIAFGQARQ